MKESLNKIHYGIYLIYLGVHFKLEHLQQKVVPQKRKENFRNNIVKHHKIICNPQNSPYIYFARYSFDYFCAGYFGLLSFPLSGIATVYFHIEDNVLILIIFAIPVLIGCIPAERVVFSNDRYLGYFKRFSKENASWHRKWRWIAVAFCLGSILFSVLGCLLMIVIMKL